MIPDALSAILARYPSMAIPLAPPESLANAGGHSGAQLWRFRSGQGMLVARAWPPGGMDATRLKRMHGWLARAGRLGFVPVPVLDRQGETIQELGGRLWEVTPWMPGSADPGRPPNPLRLEQGFAGLALFHQVVSTDWALAPSASLKNRVVEMRELLGGQFEVLQRAVLKASNDETRTVALRWLELSRRMTPGYLETLVNVAGQPRGLQVCLRDARPDHFLFVDSRLTGLVDFGASGIDLVEGDLARLLSEWVGSDRNARSEALAAYDRVRSIDESSLALIDVFETTAALLGAAHWIRWHFLERRVFEDPRAVGRGIARGVEKLEARVTEMLR